MAPLLSIIVPVYNEAPRVAAVIARLQTIELPVQREILVVNDGSTDETQAVLDRVPSNPDVLRVIHAPVNCDKGSAVRVGLREARGSIVAIQDAAGRLPSVAWLKRPLGGGPVHLSRRRPVRQDTERM